MGKVLDQTNREYLASLIPKDIPDWKASWEEGYKIGQSIEIMETPFMKKYGVKVMQSTGYSRLRRGS